MKRTTIEIWLTIDGEGQYAVSVDRDSTIENLLDNNGLNGALAVHKLLLSVQVPQDAPATITLPDDAQGEPVVLEE